jgi:hypothetical protein
VFANLVNGADIRMVKRRSSLRLTLEAFEGLMVSGYIVWQEFQCDKTMEARVFGFVDDTHAATAELLDDSVVRDSLADWSLGIRHLGRY